MRKLLAATITCGLLFASIANAQTAQELFNQKCAICHIITKPTDEQRQNLIAPPIFGVMRHVKQKYTTKESAVNFIVNYALNPSKDKSVCMSETIKKFGVMPSQKGAITKDELKAVAEYMYDNFPPKGMKLPKNEPGLSVNQPTPKTDNLSGEALVKKYGCMACHNEYGPKQAPGFAGVAKRANRYSDPVGYIADAIKNGSKGKYPKFNNMVMPPFASISKTDRIRIAEWILSLKPQGQGMGMGKGKGKGKGKCRNNMQ